jgi:uncharacterized protein YndB with AHSA1/START domain
MIKLELGIVIDKPVDQVWSFLTDFENTPKWDIGVLETRQTSQGLPGLGTTFVNVGPFLGRSSVREFKVTEYEPKKKVTVTLISPTSLSRKLEASYIFEPAPGGTELTFIGTMDLTPLFRLMQPILLQRARKDSQGDLNNLKHLLESDGSA